eukprot:36271-Eustigmatos_ZCMA.PRE.1
MKGLVPEGRLVCYGAAAAVKERQCTLGADRCRYMHINVEDMRRLAQQFPILELIFLKLGGVKGGKLLNEQQQLARLDLVGAALLQTTPHSDPGGAVPDA